MKPTVHYKPVGKISVGNGAFVIPLDHPGNINDGHPWDSIKNGSTAYTSPVISHDEQTGRFETRNTIYVRSAQ